MEDLCLQDLITDTAGAAKQLGVSTERVRQLDDVLAPVRLGARGFRVFDRRALSRYAAQRDAKRGAK